jgi:hypothetical protein
LTFVETGQYRRVALLERIFINHSAKLRRRPGAGNPRSPLVDQTRFIYSLIGAKLEAHAALNVNGEMFRGHSLASSEVLRAWTGGAA